jgi:hypothetical protein
MGLRTFTAVVAVMAHGLMLLATAVLEEAVAAVLMVLEVEQALPREEIMALTGQTLQTAALAEEMLGQTLAVVVVVLVSTQPMVSELVTVAQES